jgi:hypothetical protein
MQQGYLALHPEDAAKTQVCPLVILSADQWGLELMSTVLAQDHFYSDF